MEIDDRYEALRFLTHNLPKDFKQLENYERSCPEFASLVDLLTKMIVNLKFSPSEVRQAGMYACYKAEMICVRPTFMQAYLHELEKK